MSDGYCPPLSKSKSVDGPGGRGEESVEARCAANDRAFELAGNTAERQLILGSGVHIDYVISRGREVGGLSCNFVAGITAVGRRRTRASHSTEGCCCRPVQPCEDHRISRRGCNLLNSPCVRYRGMCCTGVAPPWAPAPSTQLSTPCVLSRWPLKRARLPGRHSDILTQDASPRSSTRSDQIQSQPFKGARSCR